MNTRRKLLTAAVAAPLGGLIAVEPAKAMVGGLTAEQDHMLREVHKALCTPPLLKVNVAQMNGADLLGSGVSADRWRGSEDAT
jgi:hypothetical protein